MAGRRRRRRAHAALAVATSFVGLAAASAADTASLALARAAAALGDDPGDEQRADAFVRGGDRHIYAARASPRACTRTPAAKAMVEALDALISDFTGDV